MKLEYITLFPNIIRSYFKESLFKRAVRERIISYTTHDLRDFGVGKHKKVDDAPYGGGGGMLLRADVVAKALASVKPATRSKIIMLSPQGVKLTPKIASRFSKYNQLIFLSGRYEGFDERIRELVDFELSIGDYVLTAGDLPALVATDVIARFIPGFLGNASSSKHDSFSLSNKKLTLLEYPQYTKPLVHKGKTVPRILLSGNHNLIKKWRLKQAKLKTKTNRPDMV